MTKDNAKYLKFPSKPMRFIIISVIILLIIYVMDKTGNSLYVKTWKAYNDLNIVQEEVEWICQDIMTKHDINFEKQNISLRQDLEQWEVEISEKEKLSSNTIYEFYNMDSKTNIKSLRKEFSETLYSVSFNGKIYQYNIGEYEKIFFISKDEIKKIKEKGENKWKKIRNNWYVMK